ncbi:MAG: tRNA glutamyl-Q(34) synthetase GluQRS [Halieaceae bacterium]|nr:tRNA glutamyl-Q(34) synthetase GluQRS [Halieaceae bacterium]
MPDPSSRRSTGAPLDKTISQQTASAQPDPGYTGRFAPSPTGPLHLGTLICALASYLDARHQGGRWLLRMEDLDPPRQPAGAAQAILDSLREHGLNWDGPVLWQSGRHTAYGAVVDRLLAQGIAFRCDCSRQMLAASGGIYSGRCRDRKLSAGRSHAVRLRSNDTARLCIEDTIQAPLSQTLATSTGDFVIRRRDGLYAYQLAVVLDDAEQQITHVVRGSDLYDSTPRQVYLQQLLNLPTPIYSHIPVLCNKEGQKLSKQTHAPALDNADALSNLRLALKFLNQPVPAVRRVDAMLQAATRDWRPERIARRMSIDG